MGQKSRQELREGRQFSGGWSSGHRAQCLRIVGPGLGRWLSGLGVWIPGAHTIVEVYNAGTLTEGWETENPQELEDSEPGVCSSEQQKTPFNSHEVRTNTQSSLLPSTDVPWYMHSQEHTYVH